MRRRTLLLLIAAPAVWLAALNGCRCVERDLAARTAIERPARVDAELAIARRYAPWLWHEVDPDRPRSDIPAPADFDGDFHGAGNWDALARFALVPTVYYTVLETATHWFVTYHVFHPRDEAWMRIGLQETHENDGENLQVVVDRATGAPVVLLAQAHYRGRVFAAPGARFEDGEEEIAGPLHLIREEGELAPLHVAVFVESGGHGILSVTDDAAGVATTDDGAIAFNGHGIVLRPARDGERVIEPDLTDLEGTVLEVPYQLESTLASFWPGVRDGSLLGEGGLFDDTVRFRSGEREWPVPSVYEADRFSGPLGPDRGIAPFAVDCGFDAKTRGALFFDPARRWRESLRVPEPWSLEYRSPIP